MTDADKGTMIDTLRRHFPALEWESTALRQSIGRLQNLTLYISEPGHSSDDWRAALYDGCTPHNPAEELHAETLHRLIVDMQQHLRQVAMFHLRAAGGVVGDSSTPWMKELEAIDNEDNRELRIARQEALALHIADLEAEIAEKQVDVEFVDTEIGPMRRGRFLEGWTMPEPPYEGCRPVAENIDGGWLLQWFDEDDCYVGEIPWPVGPAEAVTLEDLKAAGFVIGLGGEE